MNRLREFVWDLGWWLPFLPVKVRRRMFGQIQKGTCPRCGLYLDDPQHEELPDGCRAHYTFGGDSAPRGD